MSHLRPKRQRRQHSEVTVTTGGGFGGTGTFIRYFSTKRKVIGTAISYTSDTTNGDKFTINEDGIYTVTYSSDYNNAGQIGLAISLNTASLTAVPAAGEILAACNTTSNAANGTMIATISLKAGDILRAHANTATKANVSDTGCIFRVTKHRSHNDG